MLSTNNATKTISPLTKIWQSQRWPDRRKRFLIFSLKFFGIKGWRDTQRCSLDDRRTATERCTANCCLGRTTPPAQRASTDSRERRRDQIIGVEIFSPNHKLWFSDASSDWDPMTLSTDRVVSRNRFQVFSYLSRVKTFNIVNCCAKKFYLD